MRPIDKIIAIIREEMMTANPPGGQGGYSASADAKGPVAGYDKPLGKGRKKRKKSLGVWSRSLRKK
tara:strand:+ start:1297 stop:1494 length:198 start_codon:yes stop_codon:yes gene_type:complete